MTLTARLVAAALPVVAAALPVVAAALPAGLFLPGCGTGSGRSKAGDDRAAARQVFKRAQRFAGKVTDGSTAAGRRDWNRAIDLLTQVARRFPSTDAGRKAVVQAADLAGRLARLTGLPEDRTEALGLYRAAVRMTGGSAKAKEALERFQRSGKDGANGSFDGSGRPGPTAEDDERLIQGLPILAGFTADPDKMGIKFASKSKPPARFKDVKCWHAANLARVVLRLSRPVRFSHGVLQARAGEKKARLYLDVETSRLTAAARRGLRRTGPLVRRIRAARHGKGRVRVVLEVRVPARFKIYPLLHPYRVVVDIMRPKVRPAAGIPVKMVAIDPGHGGDNKGAVGAGGLEEKKVTLTIARQLQRFLKARRMKTILTRRADRTVPLEERTASALAAGADLLVSIHANAEPTGKRQAVETYYLNTGSDKFARRLAERENAVPASSKEPYRLLLAHLVEEAITRESARLAAQVQRAVLAGVRSVHPETRDGGVKKAIFYVLLTARMPAVLVEVSHISNKQGEALLAKEENLRKIAEAIGRGILAYSKERQQSRGPKK